MSNLPSPMPRLIGALLDAERHSSGLIEALAVARAAMLDLTREDERWKKPPSDDRHRRG